MKINLIIPLTATVLLSSLGTASVDAQSEGVAIAHELRRQRAFLRTYCNPPSRETVEECYRRSQYAKLLQSNLDAYNRRRQIQIETMHEINMDAIDLLRKSNSLASSSRC
ncbi:MAG: hypothetical protein KI793_23225 [Rivularia sp. (in: Bacteria)]|nr:hypothetical protein [Rivularia sp. MS3]